MKQTIKSLLGRFLITLIAVAVAFAAYEYYKRPQDLETQAHTDALRQQARTLGEQATALKDEVDRQHRDAEREKQRYMHAAYLVEGLQAGAAIKTAVAEYFFSAGAWPASNRDLELAEPEQFNGQSLTSLRVSTNGTIILTYDQLSGVTGGTIQLIPEYRPSTGAIKWRCVTWSYWHIATTVPQCEYRVPEPRGLLIPAD